MLFMSIISQTKPWPTKHFYLNKEYSLILFREIRHNQQSEKKSTIQVLFSYGMIYDITKRKEYEHEIIEQKALINNITNSIKQSNAENVDSSSSNIHSKKQQFKRPPSLAF